MATELITTPEPCDSCGELYPAHRLTDTIAGFLCPDCEKEFSDAARQLVEICTRRREAQHGN